jgi:uncharacterized repeat protein (TIGR03803 family)
MRKASATVLLAALIVWVGAGVQTAHGQTFKVLYAFKGGTDGGSPETSLIRDNAGNLYGTTDIGGVQNAGVVFKLSPKGKETVLYLFPGTFTVIPSSLTQDSAGNLYGTTINEPPLHRFGTVYKLDLNGNRTILYSFTGGTDGSQPMGGLTLDAAGSLYGTCFQGSVYATGIVFKVDPTGKETVLHAFAGATDGQFPAAGLVSDGKGHLYGTTTWGGDAIHPNGSVFRVSTAGKEKVLYRFALLPDGDVPNAGLFRDAAGNLYGTTTYGGSGGGIGGLGTVFKLDPKGKETILYNFTTGGDGYFPYGTVVMDANGNLYGTTYYGGKHDLGTVFKLDPAGHETILHSFTGLGDGGNPLSGLILDSQGYLYGTAVMGGRGGFGTVFRVKP